MTQSRQLQPDCDSPEEQGKLLLLQNDEITMAEGYTKIKLYPSQSHYLTFFLS
jgi:hypothetical protein